MTIYDLCLHAVEWTSTKMFSAHIDNDRNKATGQVQNLSYSQVAQAISQFQDPVPCALRFDLCLW